MNFSISRQTISPLSWIIFLGYLSLLIFFYAADTYHTHFFKHGPIVIFYNSMRVLFIFYLAWIFYASGNLLLARISRQSTLTLESALQSFLTGVGLWQITLFFIGLAGFDKSAVMISASSLIFAYSLPILSEWLRYPFKIYYPGWLLILIPVIAFFITKGLYPAGGHDYYTHYFQFYKKVVDTGSIMPNEVWYHFYYSKGAGLFFLSMLLTDPLGPQLVSTTLILAAAAMVFSLLKNKTDTWLPWIGVALYFTFLIYTPGPLENMHQGGWGDLEKPHEPAAVLTLAIIWLTLGLAHASQCRSGGITLLFSICALILFSPVMVVFSSVYLITAFSYFWVVKKRSAAKWVLIAMLAASIEFIFLLSINYLLTGIPLDQGLFTFWPIINFDKVKEWGVLFELLYLHWAKTILASHSINFSESLLTNIFFYLRLDIWWPLFLLGIGELFWQKISQRQWHTKISLLALGTFLLLISLLSLIIGRDQSISFYRFTSFTYAPMLCFCLLLLGTLRTRISQGLLMSAFLLMLVGNFNGGNLGRILKNSAQFISGQYSIADANRHQRGWPGRMSWGSIYPAAEVVWSQLPPNTRIWSMHVHSYCMLPNCRMETYPSYRLSPHAKAIYFGDPDQAKILLQKEQLNYFFISNSLALTDPIVLSPLFSPNHISHYFGIAWTDGNNTLLTWKESADTAIDIHWLHQYREKIRTTKNIDEFPYQSMQAVMSILQHQTKINAPDLPWNSPLPLKR